MNDTNISDATDANAGLYHRVTSASSARISHDAGICGDVTIGEHVTILAGAQIRGDEAPVVVGDESNIQEHVTVHVDENCPTTIGKHVTIGHGAVIHGCTIDDNALIGMGSIILNGAVIGENAVVGAGALVAQNKTIPPRTLVMGVPARLVRELSDEEIDKLCTSGADIYLKRGQQMVDEGVLLSGGEYMRLRKEGRL